MAIHGRLKLLVWGNAIMIDQISGDCKKDGAGGVRSPRADFRFVELDIDEIFWMVCGKEPNNRGNGPLFLIGSAEGDLRRSAFAGNPEIIKAVRPVSGEMGRALVANLNQHFPDCLSG